MRVTFKVPESCFMRLSSIKDKGLVNEIQVLCV